MAERRMFSKAIIDSDAFIELSIGARLLYYDLGMRADDDGFVNSPKKIMRFVGATEDDMEALIAHKFIYAFPSGVVAIKHWRIHNYLRKDTYTATNYKEEKALLSVDENKAYTLNPLTTRGRPVDEPWTENENPVTDPSTQVSKGKVSKGKVSILGGETKRFTPPKLEEVTTYCNERHNNIDPQKFIDYYTSTNWHRGKTKIKDWKACIRTWEQREPKAPKDITPNYEQVNSLNYSEDEMNAYFANLKK